MEQFAIFEGRTSFWQWDLNQKLVVYDNDCNEVHFCNETDDCALVCKVYEQDNMRLVDVPNVVLQTATPLHVFTYIRDNTGNRTTHSVVFAVIPRAKPANYVYTETEVWTAERAVEKALQEAKASGDFDGANGKDGYTPIRGKDYWTEDDVAEIKSYVDEAILGGAW